MKNEEMSKIYYFEGFTPEIDRTQYEGDPGRNMPGDPDGNLAAALQEATSAYLQKSEPEWDQFHDYMEFCFKRKFVKKEDVSHWLDNLKTQPPWREIGADGRGEIILNLFNTVFE